MTALRKYTSIAIKLIVTFMISANAYADPILPGSPLQQGQVLQNFQIGAPDSLRTIGFTLQPGIVVMLETGNSQAISNWSDIIVFRSTTAALNAAAGLNVLPCALTTCIDFISDPGPESTDAGFTAQLKATDASSGVPLFNSAGVPLTIGDLANMSPTFIQEANDGGSGGLSFTSYTAGANTFRVFSDVEPGGAGIPEIPEPATVLLFASGFVILIGWKAVTHSNSDCACHHEKG